jgi:thioredoxin-dependent peroxiredoxin
MFSIRLLPLLVLCATGPLVAQAPATPTPAHASRADGPIVGDVAPDFTFTGITRYGILRDATKLSELRGQTVVLAFFPGARTPGCTIQMEKYLDTYATLFHNGANVVVIGISVDPDTALASWAHDAHFPMLFASDAPHGARGVGTLYGAYNTAYEVEQRLLYVIGPDGKIVYVAKPFDVSQPASYSDLAAAVQHTLPTTP